MAAICGLDRYRNNSDVFLEKTGQLEPEKDDNDNLPSDIGTIFENAVVQLFAKVRSVSVQQNVFLSHGNFCSNLDAFIESDNEIVEAKTCGDPDEYGEQFTDDIPERHIVQTHEAMYVVSQATGRECKVAWVPVLLPGYKSLQFRIYKVVRNDKLMSDIVSLGNNFWNEHVLTGVPPEPYQPSLETIKRIKRIPDSIADISDADLLEWEQLKAVEKSAKENLDAAKSRLLASIGDAEAGETSSGRMVTYFETNRSGFTVEPTTFRVLKLKSQKAKKRGK